MYNCFNKYADFIALFDRDEAGKKHRATLIANGIEENKLLLIPQSSYKKDCEIEDLVDKPIWDKCLRKLDKEGIITIKSSRGQIVDYEYDEQNRVDVKKSFTEQLLLFAKKDISNFSKYLLLIKALNKSLY